MLEIIRRRVEEILWNPQVERAPVPLRLLARTFRFPYALVRDAARGELTLRAMSLVYTTLLAVVPLIALSFSVLKGFDFHREIQQWLYTFLQPLGPQGVELTDKIIQFVDNTRGVALGSVGLAVLLYVVISMVQKIEEAFNFVWQVQRTRSLARRVSEYLSVIVIAPILMATALALKGTVENTGFVQWLLGVPAISDTVILFGEFMPYVLIVLAFSFVYGFVPNTQVSVKSAFVGGITGGLAWSILGVLFATFVGASTKYQAIYSSFAIPLLALIWLYISWLVVLLGARVSYYHQHPECLRRGRQRIELTNRLRERLALALMYFIGHEFRRAKPHWTINSLASHLEIPADDLGKVVAQLEKCDLLVTTEDGVMMPARDTETIELKQILDAVRRDTSDRNVLRCSPVDRVDTIIAEIERAAGEHLGTRNLRDLIEREPAGSA